MASPPPSLDPAISPDPDHGFHRPEMFTEALPGTVQLYERHVFLCFKEPSSWPSHVETSEADRLPRTLAATLKARKNDMPKKTRLTICEGRDGSDSSNGDIVIFPDMVRYKELTHFDIETFVDEVLVHERKWPSGKPEKLEGAHVFICAHASRDMRCGVCGPALIEKFKDEISIRGLEDKVFVRACSHVGGHKYAGNVIIYSPNASGEVAGHWYGYVAPDDVAILLDEHIGKCTIIEKLWRGQMGLMEAEQKEAQQHRLQVNGSSGMLESEKEGCFCSQGYEKMNGDSGKKVAARSGCCQENVGSTECCKIKKNDKSRKGKSGQCGGACNTWSYIASSFDSWERGDTLAALAVVGAVAAVAVAFHLCRKSS